MGKPSAPRQGVVLDRDASRRGTLPGEQCSRYLFGRIGWQRGRNVWGNASIMGNASMGNTSLAWRLDPRWHVFGMPLSE